MCLSGRLYWRVSFHAPFALGLAQVRKDLGGRQVGDWHRQLVTLFTFQVLSKLRQFQNPAHTYLSVVFVLGSYPKCRQSYSLCLEASMLEIIFAHSDSLSVVSSIRSTRAILASCFVKENGWGLWTQTRV